MEGGRCTALEHAGTGTLSKRDTRLRGSGGSALRYCFAVRAPGACGAHSVGGEGTPGLGLDQY